MRPVREYDPGLGIVEREFATLPRDQRPLAVNRRALLRMRIGPLAVNRRALLRMRIGPLFPGAGDPERLVGMRGTPIVGLRRETAPGVVRLRGAIVTGHDWADRRARRRARRLIANASRRANR